MHVFRVDTGDLRKGVNDLRMKLVGSEANPAIISDFAVTVDYPAGTNGLPRPTSKWDTAYQSDSSGWHRQGGRSVDDALELRFDEQRSESLASPTPEGDLAKATLIGEAEIVLNHGAVAITISNGEGFATYLVEEFGGAIPFYSTTDSRRVILTTQPHRYRIEVGAGQGRVYVDGFLYSDNNLPMPLTPLDRAGMLFTPEETAVFRRGGMLIKAVDPKHDMINRPSGNEASVMIKAARMTWTQRP